MTHRRLRPWVYSAIGAFVGVIIANLLIYCFCAVIEAFTGFNPVWLLGSM